MPRHSHPAPACLPRAQLSLIEHALCPLDTRQSLLPGSLFESEFEFTDKHRNRRTAHARIGCVHGMSAHHELYLWGLIGLALSQTDPSPDFYATPHYCLRQLGIIDARSYGGTEFRRFREGIRRLAGIRYECDRFYDPVRGEHRQVSFGLLNYSLPPADDSSRAWRFAWDPIFFEFCQSNRGSLRFDLSVYRDLTAASRRLYLFLRKQFWRRDYTGQLEIRQLGISTLGFAEQLATKIIKRKLTNCLRDLLDCGVIRLAPHQESVSQCFTRVRKGIHTVQFWRGEQFDDKGRERSQDASDSPLFDPLTSIGFDEGSVARILRQHSSKLIEQWADITLAAVEAGRIQKSPEAFFRYHVDRAAKGKLTPPDWWREYRKQQEQAERQQNQTKTDFLTGISEDAEFDAYLQTEAREAFGRITDRLRRELMEGGQSRQDGTEHAEYQARMHLRRQFNESRGAPSGWTNPFANLS